MKRMKKWTSILLLVALAFGMIPFPAADAAGSRITITNLYTDTNPATGLPTVDGNVPRYTASPISVTATVENLSDTQIQELYYEVVNVNTNLTTVEKANKAVKTGPFEITFSNVQLTEGLNKITIKYGETSTLSSAPGWVYFTPTTNIQDLKIDGEDFVEGKMYPENPAQSTTLNISGKAPNATEVLAYVLGDSSPKYAYLSGSDFFFLADDIHKTNATANFLLKPGDNHVTFIAKNDTRSYHLERNLIYDNGKPFAFNAHIQEQDSAGNLIGTSKKLITTPTVTTPNVRVSALLKVDLDNVGNLQYQYVDVLIGGKKFGPYNLNGATPAMRAFTLYPSTISASGNTTTVTLTGTGLTASQPAIEVLDKNGNSVATLGSNPSDAYVNNDGTVKVFKNLDISTLASASSPYTFRVLNGGTVLEEFSVQVAQPPVALPTVTGYALSTAYKEGYVPQTETINFSTAVQPGDVRIDFTDLTGQNVMRTALGSGTTPTTAVTYTMPAGLTAGDYKIRISYQGYVLMEDVVSIAPADPVPPTVTGVTTSKVLPDFSLPAISPTFIVVQGSNFGNVTVTDITNVRLVDDGGINPDVALQVYDVQNSYVLFRLDNVSDLAGTVGGNNTVYDLVFDVDYGAATPVTLTVDKAVESETKTAGLGNYNDEIITGVNVSQVLITDIGATTVTISGQNLNDANLLSLEIYDQSGSYIGSTAYVSSVNATGSEAYATLPGLNAGNYILKISYNGNVLADYPLTVVNPVMSSINPTIRSISSTSPAEMTVTGLDFGREANKLALRFKSDNNPSAPPVDQPAKVGTLRAGSEFKVDIPTLSEGTYSVTLLYNGQEMGSPLKYTVSSPNADLQENAVWSKDGQYKVFDFAVNVTLPPERTQLVQFKFYNFTTDNIPPTEFTFHYMDPTLPYIDRVERMIGTSSILLSESVTNEINEQPTTLRILADNNTNKVNVYLGEYNSNTSPAATLTTFTVSGTLRMFTYTLDGQQNGIRKLTVVPSSNTDTTVPKSGENTSGRKEYTLNISSTPYVIVQNIYNGMVIRSENDISCTKNGNLTGRCIVGKLVNVPATEYNNVVVRINGLDANLNTTQDAITNGTFYFEFSPARFGATGTTLLKEGGNTIEFLIYMGGVLVTQSRYDVFLFSTEAPSLGDIKPIETSDTVKYVPGGQPDTYVTSETTVALRGTFANATEIQLTVKTRDENGNMVTAYDRRYNNFSSREPVSGNPNFFTSVNNPAGTFQTRDIELSYRGDTIFEFAVTNNSGIVATKAITVTREPQPFVLIYPKFVQTANGKYEATINSNFVELQIMAEGADRVVVGKQEAVLREVTYNGVQTQHYFVEVENLKAGENKVKLTVYRGEEKVDADLVIRNVNVPVEGAQYKTELKNKISVFNKELELSFPRGTSFMRNDPTAVNQFLTTERKILFGIANGEDGRVDKYKHPKSSDGQQGNPNPLISNSGELLLREPTGRFRSASKLYWIDAGTIEKDEPDLQKALYGSGRLPYDDEPFYQRDREDLVVSTLEGTLTIQYDPALRGDSWRYVTVYHFGIHDDYTGNYAPRWKNIGGVVNPKNNTITVPFRGFGYYRVMYMDRSFDDVIGHSWARDALDTLYSKGIMLNKTPMSFMPNDAITRGEFATLLVKIFDIPLNYDGEPTFSDVPKSFRDFSNPANPLYDYRYIETAARAGIVRGTILGRFNPNSTITRQDAAVMIAQAAELKLNSDGNRVLQSLQKMFTDANSIEVYARPAVEAVVKAGLMSGKENVLLPGQSKPTYRFDPRDTMTRAEAAAIAIEVLKKNKVIPK